MATVRATATGIELDVWVTPRAAQPGLGPLHGDRMRVAVSAAPVEGEANEAVRTLVAKHLGVARGQVTVLRGASGRNKTLAISGDPAALLARAAAFGSPVDGTAPSEVPAVDPATVKSSKRKGSKR